MSQPSPPTIEQVCSYLAEFAPLELAEDWDNVGLLVGRPDRPSGRIMTCLTVTPATVSEAVQAGVDLIVTHHPLPFRPLKSITPDATVGWMLLQLIEHRVAVYSPHTAFDSAAQGINQQLAAGLGLVDIEPLEPAELAESADRAGAAAVGSGRMGRLPTAAPLAEVAGRLKQFLGIDRLRAVGDQKLSLERVAVACGSAGDFLAPARQRGCQLLVTGETSFHTCLEAEATGMTLLLTGHYASERFAVETLAEKLAGWFPAATVWASAEEADPLMDL